MNLKKVRKIVAIGLVVLMLGSLVSCSQQKSEEELKAEIRIEMEAAEAEKVKSEKAMAEKAETEKAETDKTKTGILEKNDGKDTAESQPKESEGDVTLVDQFMNKKDQMLLAMTELYYEDVTEEMFDKLEFALVDVTNDNQEEILLYGDEINQVFIFQLIEGLPVPVLNDISKFGGATENKFYKKSEFLAYEFRTPGEINDSTYLALYMYDGYQLYSSTGLIKTRMIYNNEGVNTVTSVSIVGDDYNFIVKSVEKNMDDSVRSIRDMQYTYNIDALKFDEKELANIMYDNKYYNYNLVTLQDGVYIEDLKPGDKLSPQITVLEATNDAGSGRFIVQCDNVKANGYISYNDMEGGFSVSVTERLFASPILVGESRTSTLYKITSPFGMGTNVDLSQFVPEEYKGNPYEMPPVPVEYIIHKIDSTFAYGSEGGTHFEISDVKVLKNMELSSDAKSEPFDQEAFKPISEMALDCTFAVGESTRNAVGSFDLDQDGVEDNIEVINETGEIMTGLIKINDVTREYPADNVDGTVVILDLNKNDRYFELGILDYGASDDLTYSLYRYSKEYGIESIGVIDAEGLLDGEGRYVSFFSLGDFSPYLFTAYYELYPGYRSLTPIYIEDDYKDKWFTCQKEGAFAEGKSSDNSNEIGYYEGEKLTDFKFKIRNVNYYKDALESGFGYIQGYDVALEDGRKGYLQFWMGD